MGSTRRTVAVVSTPGTAARGGERKAGGAAWEVLISAACGGNSNGQDPVRQDLGQPRHHRSRQWLCAAAYRPLAAARPFRRAGAAGGRRQGLSAGAAAP